MVDEFGESGDVKEVFGGDVGEVIVPRLYFTHSVTVPQFYSLKMAGAGAGETNVVEEFGESLYFPDTPDALRYFCPDQLHHSVNHSYTPLLSYSIAPRLRYSADEAAPSAIWK